MKTSFLLLLSFFLAFAYAEKFVVDTPLDVIDTDEELSLREAVELANKNQQEDEIVFAEGVNEITLKSNLEFTNDSKKMITVRGPIVLSGNILVQIAKLQGANVRFEKVTFQNCHASLGDGGALHVDLFSKAAFVDCSFFSNRSLANGGAIQVDGIITELTNCLFRENKSFKDGGAISTNTLSQIQAINSCVFEKNYVIGNGGAILNQGKISIVANSVFVKNQAQNKGNGKGAAVFNKNIIDEFNNCTFEANHSGADGAAYYDTGNMWGAKTVFSKTNFIENIVEYQNGGAISGEAGSNLLVKDCCFNSNTAGNKAGAIYTDGQMLIATSDFYQNSCTQHNGGAVYVNNSQNKATVIIERCSFRNNEANNGGAICSDENAVVQIFNSTLSQNKANVSGGAFYEIGTGNVQIVYSTFVQNKAKVSGGGIAVNEISKVALNSCIVTENKAKTAKDLSGTFVNGGYNLVKDHSGHNFSQGKGNNIIGEKSNVDKIQKKIEIKCHALKDNSPAINKGDKGAFVLIDQRGCFRDLDPDIGAYEYGAKMPSAKIVPIAQMGNGDVKIVWQAVEHASNFKIWRKHSDQAEWQILEMIPTLETSNNSQFYSFVDNNVNLQGLSEHQSALYLYAIEYTTPEGRVLSPSVIARTPEKMAVLQK